MIDFNFLYLPTLLKYPKLPKLKNHPKPQDLHSNNPKPNSINTSQILNNKK